MKRFFGATGYLLLLAFGVFLAIRGYQHVMLAPALIGLFLVVALLLFALFRATLFRWLRRPRPQALWAFARVFVGHIRPANLLYALPYLSLGLLFFLLITGLRQPAPAPLVVSVARTLEPWYLSEFFALCVSPFIVWMFLRDEATPLWQRIAAVPVVLLVFGGAVFFVKVLQLVWAFVLFKCAYLYFQRPTVREHALGCLQGILNICFWLVLALVFLNRPTDTRGLMDHQPRDIRVLGTAMLFGCIYYSVLGVAEIVYRPFLFAVDYFRPQRAGTAAR
ncbi:hypothetical protein EG831_00005 [bacterium]|nr:hypothetical protein [bacterium]